MSNNIFVMVKYIGVLFLVLFINLVSVFTFSGQDIIVLNSGLEIEGMVQEITLENVLYTSEADDHKEIQSADLNQVFMLIYRTGRWEVLYMQPESVSSSESPESSSPTSIEEVSSSSSKADSSEDEVHKSSETTFDSGPTEESIQIEEELTYGYKGNYVMCGVGYGNSYGGFGLRVQGRFGGKVGVGVHGGVGFFPDEFILSSIGVKLFLYRGFYINGQYGYSGVKQVLDYSGLTSNFERLYGPSALIGGDWTWGRRIQVGLNVGFGISYFSDTRDAASIWGIADLDLFDRKHPVSEALDFGVMVRF